MLCCPPPAILGSKPIFPRPRLCAPKQCSKMRSAKGFCQLLVEDCWIGFFWMGISGFMGTSSMTSTVSCALEVLFGVVPWAGLPWSVLPWVGLGHTKPLWAATMTPTHLPAKYPNLLGSILGTWWLGPPTDLGHWWLHLDCCLV